ncbi:MAG: DUF2975 domain-containing protein [Bacteroidota bacterium]
MKPNLFRSISNSLAERFPLLPRIRRSFWGLLLFCGLFSLTDLSGENGISISVKPLETTLHDSSVLIKQYAAGAVHAQGLFTIRNPTITQRALFPGPFSGVDFITILCMAIGSVIIIRIIHKLEAKYVFRKDITHLIRLLGYLLMAHGTFTLYRIVGYLPTTVEFLTDNTYTSIRSFPIMLYAELYVSLVVLAMASLYNKGIQLQEEQELTV